MRQRPTTEPDHLEAERAAWLRLSAVPGLGPARIWAVVERLGSARAAWAEGDPHLPRRLQGALAEARRRSPGTSATPQGEARRRSPGTSATPQGRPLRILTPADPGYPPALFHLHDPPCALYCAGGAEELGGDPGPILGAPIVAVVGSRAATPYGLSLSEGMARDLAAHGVVVASGLARGIDGAAHRGCLAGGGPTLAVLGCGIDVHYPPEHRLLQREIEARGVVISEYPPGTPPEPWRFPARNRILAALSQVVVVVQASARSGALLTADHALDLGRTVLAVPGAVGWSQSEGPHRLLGEGAGLATGSREILEALGLPPAGPCRPRAAPPAEGAALAAIPREGCTADQLARRLKLGAPQVSALLVALELEGRVRRLPQGVFVPTQGP